MDLFKRLARQHNYHGVWRDFVEMSACSISNSVDRQNFEAREARYMEIIKRYSKEEAYAFPELFALTVAALHENSKQDFLGRIFEELGLGNKAHSQFFTPYHIAELMASISLEDKSIIDGLEERGYIKVSDPACGAGVMLIAFADALEQKGYNYQRDCLFVAEDIDIIVAQMCYIQLSLLGCPGYVMVHNTLFSEPCPEDKIWYTPFYFTEVWELRRQMEDIKAILTDPVPNVDEEQKRDGDNE